MINEITELKKIQEQCSNIFLLDENLCLGNSYKLINNNIISLSSAINNLYSTINYLNSYYTHFTINSSKYIEMNNNINDGYEKYNNAYTLVNTYSSDWTKPIGVFYNEMLLVSDWTANKYGSGSNYPQNKFVTWLNANFPPINFMKSQNITLHLTLYQSVPFIFDAGFRKTYNESCYLAPYNVTMGCNGYSCNASSGSSDECGDPIIACSRNSSGGYSGSVSCPTTGQKQLVVTHSKTNYDTHTSTSVALKYKKNSSNTSWEYINQI